MENKVEFDENGVKQVNVDTDYKKCPSCGANMVFDPESQMLYCSHCGTKQNIDNVYVAQEISMYQGLSTQRDWDKDETSVFRCQNCGAKVVLAKNETAKNCPFCGTPYVQVSDELAGLKPNGLLPFEFDAENAINFSKTWAKKRFFAPRKFKKNMGIDNVKGVYTPCFTFDSHTTSLYKGRVGKYHTRVVGSGKNRRTETYIVWRNIQGTFYQNFDDVLITAGKHFDQKNMEKIQPYDSNSAKEFEESFMLGFMAYHYDVDISDCWNLAKDKIDATLRKQILAQYNYDVVNYLDVSTQHEAVTYKYVMLPVYVGNFNYNKKLYNFYINGCTGKVTGKTPKSPWRILATVLLGLAAVVGLGFLVYYFGLK